MSTKSIFIYALAVGVISCGGDQPKEENLEDSLTDIFEELNEELSDIEGVLEIYNITNAGAGDFNLGDPIPSTSEEFMVEEKSITVSGEEGPYEETVYSVSDENEELLSIAPGYNYETGEYLNTIGELNIFSDRFQTIEGLGVGSTISEFIAAYPTAKIWYTYVSDMYVIEAEGLDAQFILDGNGILEEIEITSDMIELEASNFKEDTQIVTVRMYTL